MLESEDYMRFLDDALELSLQEPYDRFLGWVGCLGVGACTSVEGVVAANPVSGVEFVVAGFAVQAVCTAATSHLVRSASATISRSLAGVGGGT